MKKALVAISVVLLLMGLYLAISGFTSSTRRIDSFLDWGFLKWSDSRAFAGIVTAFAGLCVFIVTRVMQRG